MFATKRRGKLAVAASLSAAVILSACGTDPGDRAVSGGLLGAGTGAAIGSLTGSVGTGALIGGLGGAAVGAFTSPNAINLGDPVWRREAHRSTRTAARAHRCYVHDADGRAHRVACRRTG